MLFWLFVVFSIGQAGVSLLFILVIITGKSRQDILQGVSKLDYLVKVSVFQKEKKIKGLDKGRLIS